MFKQLAEEEKAETARLVSWYNDGADSLQNQSGNQETYYHTVQ